MHKEHGRDPLDVRAFEIGQNHPDHCRSMRMGSQCTTLLAHKVIKAGNPPSLHHSQLEDVLNYTIQAFAYPFPRRIYKPEYTAQSTAARRTLRLTVYSPSYARPVSPGIWE
jgi:hypothetical protein